MHKNQKREKEGSNKAKANGAVNKTVNPPEKYFVFPPIDK